MRLALIQMCNAGSIEKNLEKSLQSIRIAAENNADLVLFPEVQLTEFFPQYRNKDVSAYGFEISSEVVKAFQSACRRTESWLFPIYI